MAALPSGEGQGEGVAPPPPRHHPPRRRAPRLRVPRAPRRGHGAHAGRDPPRALARVRLPLRPGLPRRLPAAPQLLLLHRPSERRGRRPRDRRRGEGELALRPERSCRGIAGCSSVLVEPGEKPRPRSDRPRRRPQGAAGVSRPGAQEATPGLLLYAAGRPKAHGFPLDIALDDPAGGLEPRAGESSGRPSSSAIRRPDPRRRCASSRARPRSRCCAASARPARRPFARALRRSRPGNPQREAEAAVVSRLHRRRRGGTVVLAVGDDGPNSAFPAPFESLVDYRHLEPRHAGRRGRAGGRGLRHGPLQGRRRPHGARLRPLRRRTARDLGASRRRVPRRPRDLQATA